MAANGNTPLHVAASFGDEELVRLLLAARGISVNVLNSNADGATPLHCAVMHGKLSFFISFHFTFSNFYCAMHYSAKRGLVIACRLSVHLSVMLVDQDDIR